MWRFVLLGTCCFKAEFWQSLFWPSHDGMQIERRCSYANAHPSPLVYLIGNHDINLEKKVWHWDAQHVHISPLFCLSKSCVYVEPSVIQALLLPVLWCYRSWFLTWDWKEILGFLILRTKPLASHHCTSDWLLAGLLPIGSSARTLHFHGAYVS